MTGFSATRAAVWSLSWALGVALGVALGAYLTVIGSAAAPGAQSLGSTELLLLPLAAGAVVFVVSFVGRVGVAFIRGLTAHDSGSDRAEEQEAKSDEI